MPASAKSEAPLIPRQDLFGNPEKTAAEVSPDGKWIGWLAPKDGVMNVWVAPIDKPEAAVPVTDDKNRGIRMYHWTYDGVHLIYMQDEGGDENWHVYAVDVANRTTKDLTPFPGVRGSFAGRSRKIPGENPCHAEPAGQSLSRSLPGRSGNRGPEARRGKSGLLPFRDGRNVHPPARIEAHPRWRRGNPVARRATHGSPGFKYPPRITPTPECLPSTARPRRCSCSTAADATRRR